jgi:uncharacterized protein
MLVEFRVENFRSFRDEQVLSMVAGSGKELPGNTIETPALPGKRLLRSAVIYGANAAGKSSLVSALDYFSRFIQVSAEERNREVEPAVPFAFDSVCSKAPSRFELSFIMEGVRYQYGFAVSSKGVEEEWLFAYPKGSPQRWFQRSGLGKEKKDWEFGRHLRGAKAQLAELTRPDALFLSVASKFNNEQLALIVKHLASTLNVFDLGDIFHLKALHGVTATFAESEKRFAKSVASFLRSADVGISGVEVIRREEELSKTEKLVREQLPEQVVRMIERETEFQVQTFHKAADENVPLRLSDESLGTQKLFALASAWLFALRKGYSLVFDELHASMHPLMTRRLVELVHNPETNPGGGQLVFTCHDTTLLDSDLFRRDQIYFVEKDKEGASHLYSLQDYRPRKGEAFQRGYLAGRYGALPFLGELKF